MYKKIVNPKTGKKVSIYRKLGKKILENYINQISSKKFNGGTHRAMEENLKQYNEEAELVSQILKVYGDRSVLKKFAKSKKINLDKIILEFIIIFSIRSLDAYVKIPKDWEFVRTANSRNPLPGDFKSDTLTFMNANARGNFEIPGSHIDSVIILKAKKDLKFVDLTKLSFIFGSQIKQGFKDSRGFFASCCKTPDIIDICKKLKIDGIINFDSIDSSKNTHFSDVPDYINKLPINYNKIYEDCETKLAAPTQFDERGLNIIEAVYPEFVIVNHGLIFNRETGEFNQKKDAKLEVRYMMEFSEFYRNRELYLKNGNLYKLSLPDIDTCKQSLILRHRTREILDRRHQDPDMILSLLTKFPISTLSLIRNQKLLVQFTEELSLYIEKAIGLEDKEMGRLLKILKLPSSQSMSELQKVKSNVLDIYIEDEVGGLAAIVGSMSIT